MRPLPPVRGVDGSVTFNRKGLTMEIGSGTMASQRVKGGQVAITGLDRGRDAMTIRVDTAGPIREALTLLDHPRLNLLSRLDLDPAASSGQSAVQLAFAFPLRGAVQLQDIDIGVQGKLTDIAMSPILLGQDLTHGQLQLDLDQKGMMLAGTADFASIPLTLVWHEAFSRQAAWRSEIQAEALHVRPADRIRLGLDLAAVAAGPLAATVHARLGWKGEGSVQVDLDLRQTELMLPWLAWRKTAGKPAKARANLRLAKHRPLEFSRIGFEANALAARGMAQFNAAGTRVTSLTLQQLAWGASELSNVVFLHRGTGIEVTIGGGVLDAQPFMRSLRSMAKRAETATLRRKKPNDSGKDETAHAALPVQVQVPGLRRVVFGPGRYVQHVKAELTRRSGAWQVVDIAGQLPVSRRQPTSADASAPPRAPQRFSLHYGPASKGTHQLSVDTDDLGATLRALHLFDRIHGGRVAIKGQIAGTAPDAPLRATIEVKNFTVQDAPVLAHLLAAASLPGLVNLLSHDGLKFTHLASDIMLHERLLTIEKLRSHGGSLGLTAHGDVDFGGGSMKVRETIIPVYGVNSLLGRIPVINLLVGGKGQGLVAVNYHVTGRLENPKVFVNPASALTPGFLRWVFNIFDRDGHPDTPSPPDASDD